MLEPPSDPLRLIVETEFSIEVSEPAVAVVDIEADAPLKFASVPGLKKLRS